jgi:hypothetical protein
MEQEAENKYQDGGGHRRPVTKPETGPGRHRTIQSGAVSTTNPLFGTLSRPQNGRYRRRETNPAGDGAAGKSRGARRFPLDRDYVR